MKIGIYTNGFGFGFDDLRTMWQTAEKLDFDAAFICDNSTNGLRGYANQPNWDAWTVLPALAASTERLRMGPFVSPARRRHPAVLAKMTSCFDVMSGGRLILGMGASDYPQFWLPWGMGFPTAKERIAILSEEIQVVKRMWTEPRANFDGAYFRLYDAVNLPKPLQDPRPPIWVGVTEGRKLMPEVVAKHGDGVALVLQSDEEIKERLDDIAGACSAVGRDFDEVEKVALVYVTLTEDPNYDFRTAIAAQCHEMDLGGQVTARYVEAAEAGTYRISGTPEQVGAAFDKLGRMGLDYLVVHFIAADTPLGCDIDAVVNDMQIFATEIMPNVA